MIHLALTSDLSYLPWCAVPIASALDHLPNSEKISIHLLLSEDCRATNTLIEIISNYQFSSIRFYTYFVDPLRFRGFPVSGHGSTANYYRLLIPSLLPAEISKVLYLDCDLLVSDSILPLWHTELSQFAIGAVSDMSLFETEAKRLGLDYLKGTFNSGVLLLNLPVLRSIDLERECLEVASRKSFAIKYWDQDLLNVALANKWFKLDYSWNVQHGHMLSELIQEKYPVDKPKILHFSGSGLKPWQSMLLPGSSLYMARFRQLGITPVRHFSLDNLACIAKLRVSMLFRSVILKIFRLSLLHPALIRRFPRLYSVFAQDVTSLVGQKTNARSSQEQSMDIIDHFYPSLCVQAGPFQGLRFPNQALHLTCRPLLPRLAGTYELEMANLFTPEFLSRFSEFYDVGCSDGYYSVGSAMLSSSIKVFACNADSHSHAICQQLADLNNVADRLRLVSRLDLHGLFEHGYSLRKRFLLLVDCDGGEAVIFSAEVSHLRRLLGNATVIVKSRESCRPGITNHLIQFFHSSHLLRRIQSVPDILRPSYYRQFLPDSCDELNALSILSEYAEAPVEWLIFEPMSRQ